MAPTFGAVTTVQTRNSAFSLVAPAGLASGDFQLVVLLLASASAETITSVPTGWTLLGSTLSTSNQNTFALAVYRSTTATGTATFTKSGSSRPVLGVRLYWEDHGGYIANSYSAFDLTSGGFASTIPSKTVANAQGLVIAIAAQDRADLDSTSSATPPAGFTERYDTSQSAYEYLTLSIADRATTVNNQVVSGSFAWSGSATDAYITGSLVIASGQLLIAPTSIPSAEAVGRPTVVPGEVTISIPAGVPSAEAVGSPSLVPVQGIEVTAGIPSAEAVGTPTVVPGAAVLKPTSIYEGVVGTPTLIPGTATVVVNTGVPSGESVGTPVVSFGIAAVDLPKAFPRTEIPYPEIEYELICVARIPQQSGVPLLMEIDPIDWTGLSYSDELSKASRLDVSVNISSLTEPVLQRLRALHANATELWLYRQGKKIFAGPLLGGQVQGESITLQSTGLLGYLRYMFVIANLDFVQIDQHLIAKGLVDHWQGLPYGNFGIDTSQVVPSGMLRDATYLYKELHNIGQRVEELGKRDGGFDIEVDPVTRQLVLWSPQQGVDRSTGPDALIFDARNITSGNILFSAAPGDVASDAIGTGTGQNDTVYGQAFNDQLRATFGRTGVAASFDGVSEQSTIDAYVQGLVNARGEALLVPGPEVRTTTDADLADYNVGDTVAYTVSERLGVEGVFRVRKRTVSVSKIGREKSAIEFV